MLSAAQLTAMQNAVKKTFDQTATVQRNANLGTSGTYGEQTESWGTVSGLNNVAVGVVLNGKGVLADQAALLGDPLMPEFHFAVSSDVRLKDRIIYQSVNYTIEWVGGIGSYPTLLPVLASVMKVK